jgi:predicted MFS family arabinose efflux permease
MSTPKTAATAHPEKLDSAARFTVLAVGIAVAITAGDPTILAGNLGKIVSGLNVTVDTACFIAGLATLTSAAATLGAGTLGDLFGSKRLFVIGLLGAIGCDLVSMAAPSAAVLMAARAVMGVCFALLFGLALAIISSAVIPQQRAKAIGLFLGATALAHMPLPMIGDWLANTIGWRAMFSVSPVVALVSLPIALRYMPESPKAEGRGVDVQGMLAAAVMLLGLVYGISQVQNRDTVRVIASCLIGLIAGVLFIWWELRTPNPALDLRLFRFRPFNAAVLVGAVINFSMGGIVVAISYWVTLVKGEPSTVVGLILIPAAAAQAGASVLGGWLMSRFTARSIMTSGLAIMVVSCFGLAALGVAASPIVAAGWLSLLAVGWGLAQTPQSDIMMSYASPELAGSVSAARSGIGQAFYALGPTVYTLVIMSIFVTQARDKLVEQGISEATARAALRIVPGSTEGHLRKVSPIDPEGAHRTVAGSEYAMAHALQTMNLMSGLVPLAVLLLVWFWLPVAPSGPHRLYTTSKASA